MTNKGIINDPLFFLSAAYYRTLAIVIKLYYYITMTRERRKVEIQPQFRLIEGRVAVSFRIYQGVFDKLKELSKDYAMSNTGVVETLILHGHRRAQIEALDNLTVAMQDILKDIIEGGALITSDVNVKLWMLHDILELWRTRQTMPKKPGKEWSTEEALQRMKDKHEGKDDA